MSTHQLTGGICQRLATASPDEQDLFDSPHTVQLLSIKQVIPANQSTNPVDRYRIILSDGVHFVQAMLATQLNNMVKEGAVGKHAIVVIEKLTCNYVQEKRLIIVLALRVLENGPEVKKIGNPVAMSAENAAQQNGASPAATSSTTTPAAQQHAPAQAQSSLQQPHRQQQASHRGGRSGSIYPIEGLSPYQNNWTIKARVTQKSDMRTWSNQRGEGKLFNVTLMDETGEIKATAFNAVADELYPRLEEGKVYFISKARVNIAKKKFSHLSNDYELGMERNTEIEECHETTNLPMVKYNFVPLSGLEDLAKDSTCDVIAVVKEVGPLGEITSKQTNRNIPKRELTLVDKSGYSVRLTLWGKQAEQYNADDSPVIAFKGVKVGDFNGRSLSMVSSSIMNMNPDIEEAFALRGWYDSFGAEQPFQSHSSSASTGAANGAGFNRSELRNLHEVKEAQLGMSDKPDYFSTRATIMHIKGESLSYPACPDCNKKVVQEGGAWRCEKCDRSHDRPEHRYIMTMAAADWSGQAWLQGFSEVGNVVFGMTANELVEIKERDDTEYNAVLAKATCKTFNVVCRAKQETFNDQTRVRYSIVRIHPLDYKEEGHYLVQSLKSPWAMGH